MAESKISEFKMAEYKMAAIINLSENWMSLSQNQSGGLVFLSQNQSGDKKVSESKMAVSQSNMAEIKMAAINKVFENPMSEVVSCRKSNNWAW